MTNLVLHPSLGIVHAQLPSGTDNSNLLAGNLKKYQTMNIGYISQDINSAAHAICVNNEEIKTVENLKLLGGTIDSKLNFTDHIVCMGVARGVLGCP